MDIFQDVAGITDCTSDGFSSDLPTLITTSPERHHRNNQDEGDEEEDDVVQKRIQETPVDLTFGDVDTFNADIMVDLSASTDFSPRKTRSNFKVGPSVEILNDEDDDDILEIRKDTAKRTTINRKK